MKNSILEKKKKERDCLDKAIKIGLKKQGETKKIIHHFVGKDFSRMEDEIPDFVRVIHASNKNEKDTLLGIEHFRVDQLSERMRNDKISSTSILTEKEITSIYNKYNNKLGNVSSYARAGEDIAQLISRHLNRYDNSSLLTLENSFKYTLDNHLNQSSRYIKNLKELAKSQFNIELAFLIEVNAEFHNLFLHDDRGVCYKKGQVRPLFTGIVEMLEDLYKNGVDYVVLFFRSSIGLNDPDVIALRTRNIKRELEKQKARVYELIDNRIFNSRDITNNIELHSTYNSCDQSIVLELSDKSSRDEVVINNSMMESVRKVFACEKRNIYYATTPSIELLAYIYRGFVYDWEDKDGFIKPILFNNVTEEMLLNRKEEFDLKYMDALGNKNE